MRTVPHWAQTHFFFAALGFVILAGGEPKSLAAGPIRWPNRPARNTRPPPTCWWICANPTFCPKRSKKTIHRADFECFRATRMQLVKLPNVLIAALLGDPKVPKQPSIQREQARHRALKWLGNEIRVDCPDQRSGILTVSLTSSDPNEAAVLVNAVVSAYMNEFIDVDRRRRRERLSDLQMILAEKEDEVRSKREDLKRQLENFGAGDDQNAAARKQLAVSMCLDCQREFQKMRAEYRVLRGKLTETRRALEELEKRRNPRD